MADIKITQKYNADTFLEEIECVVSKVDVDKNFEKAVGEIMKTAVAPGFRKGHVPKNAVLKQNLQQISDKAIDISIQLAAENIVNLTPRPLEPLSVQSINPGEDGAIVIKFAYIPYPDVKLGDMEKIKVSKLDAKKATSEEVEKEITNIWFHYASRLDPELKKEDFSESKIDADFFEKSEIKKDNPALTSYLELKKFIEEYINQTYESDANINWEKLVQDEIVKKAEYIKAEALVEKELDKRLQNYKAKFTQIGMDADEYMKSSNVKIDELKAEWKPQAEKDVKLELVLQKYGEIKKFEPSEEEIKENLSSLDAETKKMYDNDEVRMRALIRYYFINQKSYNDILASVRENSGIKAPVEQ
jgi:FKBP-type peptidyl-prolyl cis-trans isomerase (trigger factor)